MTGSATMRHRIFVGGHEELPAAKAIRDNLVQSGHVVNPSARLRVQMRLARHRHTVMYFLAYFASSSKAMSRLAADQTASSLLRS